MRAWKRWLFKCQLPQDLWVLAVEKAQSDLLLFLPVGIRGKWAGATGNSRLGWFGGLWSPWLHGGRKVSVSWALQRLANVDYTTFTRRKDVIPTFCCCCFWSCLIMCGWKEDKVYSALLYASERQLRRKACLHMSGKAEVNLDWSWTQKGVGVVLCSPALRDSTNGLIIALTSCLLFFFLKGTVLSLLLPAPSEICSIPCNCLGFASVTLSACIPLPFSLTHNCLGGVIQQVVLGTSFNHSCFPEASSPREF